MRTAAGGYGLLASTFLVATGAIHVRVAAGHSTEWGAAVGFTAVGMAQLGVAILLLVHHERGAQLAVVAAAVPLAAWAWTRVAPLPPVHDHAEAVGTLDGFTAAAEIVVVALIGLSLRRGDDLWWLPDAARAVPLVAGLVLLAGGAVLVAGTGDRHDHGAGSPSVHEHRTAQRSPAGCPEKARRRNGPTAAATDPGRLRTEAAQALAALADRSIVLPCGAVRSGDHDGHGGHDAPGDGAPTGAEATRTPAEDARFERQWQAAVDAAGALATPRRARAEGYVPSAAQVPGVGAHWTDWTIVDRPFDPAEPSMLLFHRWPGEDPRLVGLSYWVRSSGGPPDGFAGPEDRWHRHLGLCFQDGWLLADGVPAPADCPGTWVSGHDLWMLHAWVVPEAQNPHGRFAGRNPTLCPGDRMQVPDVLRCPAD